MLIIDFSLIHKMQNGYGARLQLYQTDTFGKLTYELMPLNENQNFKSSPKENSTKCV